jgi:hypothetical protein
MSRRGHSFYFFLTPAEQIGLLKAFEARHPLSYYRAGTFSTPDANGTALSSLLGESSLGQLAIGDWTHSPGYLLTAPDEGVVVRKITLPRGGYAYSVDQSENPELARLKPSGQFAEGLLVAGSVDTCARFSYSGLLFHGFGKLLKQRTRRIGAFWVGSEAEEKLRLGWRLVTSASSPREYDLALE